MIPWLLEREHKLNQNIVTQMKKQQQSKRFCLGKTTGCQVTSKGKGKGPWCVAAH